jgi:hypothetical protein
MIYRARRNIMAAGAGLDLLVGDAGASRDDGDY